MQPASLVCLASHLNEAATSVAPTLLKELQLLKKCVSLLPSLPKNDGASTCKMASFKLCKWTDRASRKKETRKTTKGPEV